VRTYRVHQGNKCTSGANVFFAVRTKLDGYNLFALVNVQKMIFCFVLTNPQSTFWSFDYLKLNDKDYGLIFIKIQGFFRTIATIAATSLEQIGVREHFV
jgi:hypothetical protein